MIKELHFTDVSHTRLSDIDLENIHRELGFSLPQTFIEFVQRYNGGYPAMESSFYPVPKKFSDFYEEYGAKCPGVALDGFYGFTEDFKNCNALKIYRRFGEELGIKLFPIAFDLLGNHVVIKGQALGEGVFVKDHELWESDDIPRLFCIADGLEQFYNGLVTPSPELAT